MINIINLINITLYKRLWQMYGHDIKETHKWLYNIINYSIYNIIYLKFDMLTLAMTNVAVISK